MEEIKRTEIASLGEFGLIERLTGHIQLKNTSTLKGVGDDSAVLDYQGKQTLIKPIYCSKVFISTLPMSR